MATNHPRVKLSNSNSEYDVILDMTIPYRYILQQRLTKLHAFVAKHTLESVTQLVNEEGGIPCTPEEINKVMFGSKGLIPSTQDSISGNNTNRPESYSGRLVRRDGSPFFFDSKGRQFVRGVIVKGHYPYKEPNHVFTAIRNFIEEHENLPRYIRHEIQENDETVDRDWNNEPQ